MRKTHVSVAFAAVLATSAAATAGTGDFAKVDVNGDGKITLQEAMKLHPEWTADAFKALDTNGDGALNQLEYETAMTSVPPAAANENTASTTVPAATTESNTAVKTMRKNGPAIYLDQVGPNDVLASTLIGMRVYAVATDIDDAKTYPADSRKDWSNVGKVKDVVLDWDGSIKAVVLGVGGFLGIGEKDVAVDMASLRKVRESADSNDWFLVVNSSKEMLTQAPAYASKTKS